jgi:protein CpxP
MIRRAYVYFVLTFVLGAVVGASGTFFYAWHTGNWHRSFSRQHLVERMTHDLNLNPAQVGQLDQILQESGKQFHALQGQVDQQFEALHEQTRNRIRQILTPDQLARFNELVRQHDEKRRRGRRP